MTTPPCFPFSHPGVLCCFLMMAEGGRDMNVRSLNLCLVLCFIELSHVLLISCLLPSIFITFPILLLLYFRSWVWTLNYRAVPVLDVE